MTDFKDHSRKLRFALTLTLLACFAYLYDSDKLLSQTSRQGLTNEEFYSGEQLICAIDLNGEMYNSRGLETGMNYEMLKQFAEDRNCKVHIIPVSSKDGNYIDSLRMDAIDILVIPSSELSDSTGVVSSALINDRTTWVIRDKNPKASMEINNWICGYMNTDDFEKLKDMYMRSHDPERKARKQLQNDIVSPYDDLIRHYAEKLGWDWRMLAAVIYQESRFSIDSRSHRGALGLMQVMPRTGRAYGVDNLLDPEQNLIAGTEHLKYLQNMFKRMGVGNDELIKFTLAAYNAGEGRIIDCRNFAEIKSKDINSWDEVASVIPLMNDNSILEEESVKHGKFKGTETLNYVENIMGIYESICKISKES